MKDPGLTEWTLTEAAKLLDEPQHRLIYLCEKGVVQPDLQDAEGRGSSRRFSDRNLLEFAVALQLRDIELSASMIGGILHVLRAFERTVAGEIPGFRLPDSLRDPEAPDLRVVVSDGQRLFFSLGKGKTRPRVFGGIELRDMATKGPRSLFRSLTLARGRPARAGDFGGPEGSQHARLEISITRLAQDLRLAK